ncbi:MAG TPA: hypothetical protein VGK49_11170, partial [Ilumatobacteraceae bacterium]
MARTIVRASICVAAIVVTSVVVTARVVVTAVIVSVVIVVTTAVIIVSVVIATSRLAVVVGAITLVGIIPGPIEIGVPTAAACWRASGRDGGAIDENVAVGIDDHDVFVYRLVGGRGHGRDRHFSRDVVDFTRSRAGDPAFRRRDRTRREDVLPIGVLHRLFARGGVAARVLRGNVSEALSRGVGAGLDDRPAHLVLDQLAALVDLPVGVGNDEGGAPLEVVLARGFGRGSTVGRLRHLDGRVTGARDGHRLAAIVASLADACQHSASCPAPGAGGFPANQRALHPRPASTRHPRVPKAGFVDGEPALAERRGPDDRVNGFAGRAARSPLDLAPAVVSHRDDLAISAPARTDHPVETSLRRYQGHLELAGAAIAHAKLGGLAAARVHAELHEPLLGGDAVEEAEAIRWRIA